MKPVALRSLAGLLCCFCIGMVSSCTSANQDASSSRRWVAALPNPFDRDRPQPLIQVVQSAQAGKTQNLYVEGEVLRISPLLNGMAYEIEDATGRIWIQTQRKDVILGEIVHIQGKLHLRETSVGGQTFSEAYLEELRQVEAD